MKRAGTVCAVLVWIACWLIAPASWWFTTQVLDETAFTATMQRALLTEDLDGQITARATSQVIDQTRRFVHDTLPMVSAGVDALLERAEPAVTELVGSAVSSEPGERAMLGVSRQAHAAFLAWLDEDSLGRPGLQADLGAGEARFDLDELLTGQHIGVGPLQVPLDALDLPGLAVPVPLPPDWMRIPLTLLRSSLIPALVGIALSAAALVALDRPRLRALAVASGTTAVLCGAAIMFARISWRLSGADSVDWPIARALGALLVDPLLATYAWVAAAMAALTVVALLWDRRRLVDARASA